MALERSCGPEGSFLSLIGVPGHVFDFVVFAAGRFPLWRCCRHVHLIRHGPLHFVTGAQISMPLRTLCLGQVSSPHLRYHALSFSAYHADISHSMALV